jgi:hypothetical protein
VTTNDAMRVLQHASFYIFSTRVVGGPGKTMRGSVDVWQAMATLDRCRNLLLRTQIVETSTSSEKSGDSLFTRAALRRSSLASLMLCC